MSTTIRGCKMIRLQIRIKSGTVGATFVVPKAQYSVSISTPCPYDAVPIHRYTLVSYGRNVISWS